MTHFVNLCIFIAHVAVRWGATKGNLFSSSSNSHSVERRRCPCQSSTAAAAELGRSFVRSSENIVGGCVCSFLALGYNGGHYLVVDRWSVATATALGEKHSSPSNFHSTTFLAAPLYVVAVTQQFPRRPSRRRCMQSVGLKVAWMTAIGSSAPQSNLNFILAAASPPAD